MKNHRKKEREREREWLGSQILSMPLGSG